MYKSIRIFINLFESNWQQSPGSKISMTEKILPRMEVLHHILYITIKGGGIRGYVKSMRDRLGRQEKVMPGNLWDGIKSKRNTHTPFLHRWVRRVNKEHVTWHSNNEEPCGLLQWEILLTGLENGNCPGILKVCCHRRKKSIDRLS